MPSSEPPPQTGAEGARRDAVLRALNRVLDPASGKGLAEAGLVRALAVRGERAGFMLEVEADRVELYRPVRDAAEAAIAAVPGVRQAQVALTTLDPSPPGGARRLRTTPSGAAKALEARSGGPPAAPADGRPPHVKKVLAVASGKGGVGKSTVAVNLACAFARLGLATGLLDADVYGPSAPRLRGLSGEPKVGPDKRLQPLSAFGVKAASIGFLVPEGSPMIWRGPMASSALSQLLFEVAWGGPDQLLDLLVVDMPPGTGDVQLTLAQKVRLDGAVIVTTPQEIALIDVRRSAAMFQKTAAPILGVVENMAYFEDPAGGEPIEIFGRGGGRRLAEEIKVPFLGEMPIDIELRKEADAGRPLTACRPASPVAERFLAMAADLAARLASDASRPPPRISVED